MHIIHHTHFLDLARYIIANGRYSSFPGLDALRDCEEIRGKDFAGEHDVIFIKQRWPYALYESGFGFRVLHFPQPEPLTAEQFADLSSWISECGTFCATLPLEALTGCEPLEAPFCEEAVIDSEQIFIRNGRPVAMQLGDVGFYAVPAE